MHPHLVPFLLPELIEHLSVFPPHPLCRKLFVRHPVLLQLPHVQSERLRVPESRGEQGLPLLATFRRRCWCEQPAEAADKVRDVVYVVDDVGCYYGVIGGEGRGEGGGGGRGERAPV